MLWAKDSSGNRLEARPESKGQFICPLCNGEVIKKCGKIKIWHWAHKVATNCDPWKEPETKWHLDWKKRFSENGYETEIVIGPHKADVINLKNKIVIELQHSPISKDVLEERTKFYQNQGYKMCWLFDARKWFITLYKREGHWTFKWRWPHKSLEALFDDYNRKNACTVLLDFGKGKEGFVVDEEETKMAGRNIYKEEVAHFPDDTFLSVRKLYESGGGGWGSTFELKKL